MQKYSFKTIVRLSLPIIFLMIFTAFLNKAVISNPHVIREWLHGFGPHAIAAYIIVQTTAIVIAPLGGSAFALAILALFGPLHGTLLIYAVSTPAYIINFCLARAFGRKVVHRLTGEEGEAIISRFMTDMDLKKLIFMKMLLGGYFDYISYAVGLSTIPFSTFVLVNILAGIPSAIFTWTIMHFAPTFTSAVVFFYVVPGILGFLYLGAARFRKKKEVDETALLEHEL